MEPVQAHFSSLWGSNSPQERVNLLDFIRGVENVKVEFDEALLLDVCSALPNVEKLDHYGISVHVIKIFCRACPALAVKFFAEAMASTRIMSSLLVRGQLFGKEGATAPANPLRAILPLPACMQVIDLLLSRLLTRHIDAACPRVNGCFVGARPYTQVLDIVHGLHLIIEKACIG